MNQLTQALQSAGIKMPSQYQRIWQWLKDNGPHTVVDIASGLKIGQASVAAACFDLKTRGMLAMHPRYDHKMKPIAGNYEALGKTYELLPKPKKGVPAKKAKATAAHAPVADAAAPVPFQVITLRVPRGVAKVYEEHAKEFGVGVDDVIRLALEAYGKKMGLPLMALDPTQALRRKLEGGV